MLTSRSAEVFGINARGRLAKGLAADLTLFDPATGGCSPLRRVRDFPAGADRLISEARGIEAVAFFVPASLGVQEGGFMLGLKLAGLEPALGLTFSLALRVEQIVWAASGCAAYAGVLANRREAPRTETGP